MHLAQPPTAAHWVIYSATTLPQHETLEQKRLLLRLPRTTPKRAHSSFEKFFASVARFSFEEKRPLAVRGVLRSMPGRHRHRTKEPHAGTVSLVHGRRCSVAWASIAGPVAFAALFACTNEVWKLHRIRVKFYLFAGAARTRAMCERLWRRGIFFLNPANGSRPRCIIWFDIGRLSSAALATLTNPADLQLHQLAENCALPLHNHRTGLTNSGGIASIWVLGEVRQTWVQMHILHHPHHFNFIGNFLLALCRLSLRSTSKSTSI